MSNKMRTRAAVTAGLCAALTLTGASVALADVVPPAASQGGSSQASDKVVDIKSAEQLANAIANQEDGQTWNLTKGDYCLTAEMLSKFSSMQYGDQGGWYFPILKSDITINGNGATVTSDAVSENGAWASQNFITVAGNNVKINGLNVKSKKSVNKAIEVLGSGFVIKDSNILPVDGGNGGSLYFNGAGDLGTATVEGVTVSSWISTGSLNEGDAVSLKNVVVDFTNNVYSSQDGFLPVKKDHVTAEGLTVKVDSTIASLEKVVEQLPENTTLQLGGDIRLSDTLNIVGKKNIVIDGDSHSITAGDDFSADAHGQINLVKPQGCEGITFKNVKMIATSANKHVLDVYGCNGVVIDSVTLDHSGAGTAGASLINNGSSIVLKGKNEFVTGKNSWYAANVDNKNGEASLTVENDAELSMTGTGPNIVKADKSENGNTLDVNLGASGENLGNGIYGAPVARIGEQGYISLSDALTNAAPGATIDLLDDVTIQETLSIEKDVTINLGGHALTGKDARVFHVKSGKLTLTGKGTVITVIPEGGTLQDSSSVIRVGDNAVGGSGDNSVAAALLIDKDVTIDAPNTYGVGGFGNKTKESIEVRGTIKSVVNSALGGNGSAGLGETDFIVTSTAKLTTTNTYAIYHPQAGTLKIDGATIEGKGGIEAKGGTISISGNTKITATAQETSHNPYGNGPSTDGYAIAAVANKGYAGTPKFEISSATVKGKVATEVDNDAPEEKKGSISITGGTYSEDPTGFVPAEGYVVSKSGSNWVVSAYVPPSGGGGSTSDKTDVEHNQDGSITTTVTRPDGSQTITHETATGTESVVKKDKDGNVTSTEVSVSKADAASGKVELPIGKSEPAADASKAPEVEVKVPSTVSDKAPVQVAVPVARGDDSEPNYGIVVYAVDADGSETVLPKCAVDEDGNVVFEATGNVTIKVVDAAKDMPDVTDADWFAGGVVDFATARGIVNGVDTPSGKQFQGYGKTSRGMLVAMLHNLELNPEAASAESLPDVPEGAFYADAAAWALGEGILSGVDMPDGTKEFQGDAPVAREQVAVFLMRYAESLGMDVSARAEIDFPDASEVSAFAEDAMSWAVAEGLFKGNDVTGELNPTDGAARAEVAAVLMRFINLMYA